MPPEHECMMESRLKALEDANKNHSRTHEGIFDRIRHLETENAVQNAQYKNIEDKLDKIDGVVQELNSKAGKRWDAIVDKAIWAVCAAVIAFLLAKVGLPA